MTVIKNENDFRETLKKIEQSISRLNSQKITAFLETLGLHEREDFSKDYLQWETILIVVPSRTVLNDLKKYKILISGISFAVNTNAAQIHIYDFKEWENMTRNKTQFQIRELLKTNFGGIPKKPENRDWTKLFK
ncbi:hypothetical protein [Flavobacterium anhuiense]|uniref:hypothetical protein n=1 Tax=Flavobacterium anhuiense TaxID=459526 RepID=UPI001181E46B|nr:hypothetical protein [Flavobacterium anhuiense]